MEDAVFSTPFCLKTTTTKNKKTEKMYYAQIKKLAHTNYRRQFGLNSELVTATLNGVPVKLLQ